MARDTLFSLLPPNLAEGLIAQARTVTLAPNLLAEIAVFLIGNGRS